MTSDDDNDSPPPAGGDVNRFLDDDNDDDATDILLNNARYNIADDPSEEDDIESLAARACALASVPVPDYADAIERNNRRLRGKYGDRFTLRDDEDVDEGELLDIDEANRSTVLAERTSQILNNFKDYVAGIGFSNGATTGTDGGSGREILDGGEESVTFGAAANEVSSSLARSVRDDNKMRLLDPSSASGPALGVGDPLKRVWEYKGDHLSDFAPTTDRFVNLHQRESNYDDDDDDEGVRMFVRGQRYTHSLLHSNRVKLGMLNCFLVAVVLFSVTIGLSKKSNKSIEEVEKFVKDGGTNAKDQGTHHGNVISTMDEESKQFEDDIAKYQPMEFNRASGWKGNTYLEANEFCMGVVSKDGQYGMYHICPYKAVCPLGQGSFPIIGYKEDKSWAPISDKANDWVHLGRQNSCDRYSAENEFPPEWGIDGDEGGDQMISRLMCCLASPYVPGPVTVIVEGGAEGTPIGYDMGDTVNNTHLAIYEQLVAQFRPLEFERARGWLGQTYQEAYKLCGSMQGYGLCPYGAICPLGYDGEPIGGIEYGTSDSWAPIEGPDWVQLGQDNVCAKFTAIHDELPTWGESGVGNEEITRHVICCAQQTDTVTLGTVSSTAVDDVPEGPDQVTQQADGSDKQLYVTAGDFYEPKGFNRDTGWIGSTYDEAQTFCAGVGDGYDVCPYMALCPLGPDTEPIMGYANPDDGEQWVPIYDLENDWVAIHEDQACLKFTAMNPGVPEWGVTGEGNEALTRDLVCCLLKGGGGNVHAEDSSSSIQEVHIDVVELYAPQYFNRESGWNGKTYEDAVWFCSSVKGVKICPYDALCPLGIGGEPLWGYDTWGGVSGQTWLPISDTGNDFVQLSAGDNTTCERYSALHNESPDWGDSGEQFTQNIACCNGSILGDAEESFVYQSISLLYKPVRYNRLTGYMGQTYQDAVSFCSKKFSILCPYEAYCPFANLDTPIGGVTTNEPDGSWAPISNMENSWISIGLNHTCQQYRVVFGEAPSWGITGEGNEELTRHVMCCNSQTASGEVEVDVVSSTVAVGDGDVNDSQVSGEEEVDVVSPTVTVGGGDEDILGLYQSVNLLYQPILYSRPLGYMGQTYQDAVSFCLSKSSLLCPYQAYCPLAYLGSPIISEITNEPDGSWAPISNMENSWISIGLNHTCKQYRMVFGEAPSWGITGEGNEELTRHVMCCNNQTASGEVEVNVVSSTVALEDGDVEVGVVSSTVAVGGDDGVDSQEVPEGFEEAYKNAEMYNPVWYNRTSGWHGFTYDDAFTFCSAKGSNHDICPYEVLCPGGSFHMPYGGSINGDEVESWVPVDGAFNSWVQVITDGQVCIPWEDLNGGRHPSWGIDSSELVEDITRYILCCEMYPLSDNTASSTGSSMMSYDFVADVYAPIWYDRSDGWDGSRYVDAIIFCASKNSSIPCPYEAYCPFGEKSDSLNMAEGVWAAIIDSPNSWVSNSCVQYSSLHNSPPLWGITGGASADMTPQIMCCKEPDGHAFAEMESTNVAVATTAADEEIMQEWDPVWFSTKHGYRGTTYQDAIDFCRNIAAMVLCPKKAYCSPSPDMHLYLGKAPFSGEQWAPVATEDGASEWISVGESADVCATHKDMSLPIPEWIIDGSKPELKQNILCCQNPQHLQKELVLLNDLDPLWMDGMHGWAGGSHDDAAKYCESLEFFNFRRLCPYSAYCPHGVGQEPMGGHATDLNTEGEIWAPVYGKTNHWVMIGQKYQNRATTCMDNYQLEGEEPSWGLSYERQELKKYIMCCKF